MNLNNLLSTLRWSLCTLVAQAIQHLRIPPLPLPAPALPVRTRVAIPGIINRDDEASAVFVTRGRRTFAVATAAAEEKQVLTHAAEQWWQGRKAGADYADFDLYLDPETGGDDGPRDVGEIQLHKERDADGSCYAYAVRRVALVPGAAVHHWGHRARHLQSTG